MKYVWLALLVLATVVIQTSFFGEARPFGIIPNLFLVVIIYVGLSLPATETIVLALSGGLLLDFASGTDFGLRMAFYTVLALGVMVLAQAGADLENLSVVLIMTAGATVIYNLAVVASIATLHVHIDWLLLGGKLLLELGINMLIALLLRPILLRWLRRPSSVTPIALRNGGGGA